jgi:hypothetical protein
MPTNANTPDQRSDRYARYIQVGPTPATHLSRWVHPNGTTKSRGPPINVLNQVLRVYPAVRDPQHPPRRTRQTHRTAEATNRGRVHRAGRAPRGRRRDGSPSSCATPTSTPTSPGADRSQNFVDTFHTCPIPEIARLGRTLRQWREPFLSYWDTDRSSNGGTEAVNGLIELARRVARSFTNLDNYRLRMLLVAGGLDSVTPT